MHPSWEDRHSCSESERSYSLNILLVRSPDEHSLDLSRNRTESQHAESGSGPVGPYRRYFRMRREKNKARPDIAERAPVEYRDRVEIHRLEFDRGREGTGPAGACLGVSSCLFFLSRTVRSHPVQSRVGTSRRATRGCQSPCASHLHLEIVSGIRYIVVSRD